MTLDIGIGTGIAIALAAPVALASASALPLISIGTGISIGSCMGIGSEKLKAWYLACEDLSWEPTATLFDEDILRRDMIEWQ